jgi:hypothetical protein
MPALHRGAGLARTLAQWREPILAWHTSGPVEGLNSHQEGQTHRSQLRSFPLPATHPARLRRLQLGPTRNRTPLIREAPEKRGRPRGGRRDLAAPS